MFLQIVGKTLASNKKTTFLKRCLQDLFAFPSLLWFQNMCFLSNLAKRPAKNLRRRMLSDFLPAMFFQKHVVFCFFARFPPAMLKESHRNPANISSSMWFSYFFAQVFPYNLKENRPTDVCVYDIIWSPAVHCQTRWPPGRLVEHVSACHTLPVDLYNKNTPCQNQSQNTPENLDSPGMNSEKPELQGLHHFKKKCSVSLLCRNSLSK